MTHPLDIYARRSAEATSSPEGGLSPRSGVGNDLRVYVPLQVLLVALTFVTGVLDAVTYLDFGHVFAANMTGNFILLGLGVLHAENLSATTSLVAVAGSLIGVGAGGASRGGSSRADRLPASRPSPRRRRSCASISRRWRCAPLRSHYARRRFPSRVPPN